MVRGKDLDSVENSSPETNLADKREKGAPLVLHCRVFECFLMFFGGK